MITVFWVAVAGVHYCRGARLDDAVLCSTPTSRATHSRFRGLRGTKLLWSNKPEAAAGIAGAFCMDEPPADAVFRPEAHAATPDAKASITMSRRRCSSSAADCCRNWP